MPDWPQTKPCSTKVSLGRCSFFLLSFWQSVIILPIFNILCRVASGARCGVASCRCRVASSRCRVLSCVSGDAPDHEVAGRLALLAVPQLRTGRLSGRSRELAYLQRSVHSVRRFKLLERKVACAQELVLTVRTFLAIVVKHFNPGRERL